MEYIPVTDEKRSILLDTDLGCDCDDAGALAVLFSLKRKYGFELLGINNCTSNPYSNRAIDAVCEYFGEAQKTTGAYEKDGFLADNFTFCRALAKMASEPSAKIGSTEFYADILEKAADGSVVFVTIGQFNCLSDLLQKHYNLFKRKIYAVVSMGGEYPSGCEYNIKCDAAAAQYVLKSCPSPIYFIGFEVGAAIITTAEKNSASPVSEAYRLFTDTFGGEMHRPSWDPIAVHFAVCGKNEFYTLSDVGTVEILDDGTSVFNPDPNGLHRYVILSDKKDDLTELLNGLINEKP